MKSADPCGLVQPQNEALQQTRSALTTIAAALADERQCSANSRGGATLTMAGVGRATRVLALAAVLVSTIGCDRVTKDLAERHLAGRARLSIASDLVRLEYTENRGGFLGLGAELPAGFRAVVFNIGTAMLLVGLGVWVCRRVLAGFWAIGPALVWAGGAANLADRVARGTVMDFLNVGVGTLRTGIFNVADMAISIGVVVLVVELVGPSQTGPAHESPCRRTSGCS